MKRLKILVSAYACSPYQGSEPGVGWGFVSEMAKRHDLWVIVEEEKFRGDVERYLEAHPELSKSVRFHFLRKQRNRPLRRIWPPSYYWYYRRWQRDALQLARQLHAEVGFDLVHQLTMVGFREPGFLWQLGVPFVWGPIGGMELFPWRFLPAVGAFGALYYLAHNTVNALQARFARRPRLAAKAAGSGLIAATPTDQRASLANWNCNAALMSEVGLPFAPVQQTVRRTGPIHVVWSGVHVHRKALNLALDALASLPPSVDWRLDVVGDGPLRAAWQELAKKLGVGDRCRFHGWLPRDDAMRVMADAHVMLITSLRDLTSTVTVEALGLSLPIVCLDHCGFAGVVDESCGIKVPVSGPRATVAALRAALLRVASDEPLRLSLARGAAQRACDFSWPRKGDEMERIYRRKLAEASP